MNEYLIESLEKQLQEDPKSRVFLRLAEELRKEERFADALRVCQEGIAHHPGYMPARVCLGRVLYALKDLGQAESEFQRVVQQMPDNVHALRGLGEIALERGDIERARTLFEQLSMFDQSVDVEELLSKATTSGGSEQRPQSAGNDDPEADRGSSPNMIEVEGLDPRDVSYGGDDEELMVGGAHRLKHLDTPAEFDAEESIDITFDREPEVEEPPDDVNATIAMAAPIANFEAEDTIAVPGLSEQPGLGGKQVDREDGEDEWGNDWEDVAADIEVSGPRDLLEEFESEDSGDTSALIESTEIEQELTMEEFGADPYGMQVLQSEESDDQGTPPAAPEEVSLTLAAVYEKQGHVEEALNMLRVLNQREPENPDVLAAIHRMTNKLELESLNQRKIRFLQGWLAQVKDQHHVS